MSEQRKRRIKIERDDDGMCTSPREYNNVSVMYCEHKRYSLGDDDNVLGFSKNSMRSACNCWDDVESELIKRGALEILPVYMYDHSGITINTTGYGGPFDSGQIGFVYVTRASLELCMGWERITAVRRIKIKETLLQDVAHYDSFLRGAVYNWVLEVQTCEKCDTWQHEDSCCEFIGDDWRTNGIKDYIQTYLDEGVPLYDTDDTLIDTTEGGE